jgi:mono/diheme cytochrome c family protein
MKFTIFLLVATSTFAVDFDAEIRPLVQEHCIECHGEKKNKADLRLDAKVHAFKGGESGPAIVPGKSAQSSLFSRIITTDEDERMPPNENPLTPAQIALIKQWIDSGAEWPETAFDKAAAIDKRLQHWAYLPLARSSKAESIDSLIQKKLTDNKLTLSPPSDPRVLIRRLHFDVIGLPPTPEEVERFMAAPSSYEAQVDALLASPRLGEKWSRHWLDVVRFAESDGFETNRARDNAWPYRDYVIESFNTDKPYDQFIREQLAGDALNADAATAFLVGGATDRVKSKDPVLTANQRADELHDMVSTTAATFLALTVNCARCHNHKFDPIAQEDYYAMIAMLQGVQHGERPMRSPNSVEDEKHLAKLRNQLAPIETKLAAFQPRAHLGRVLLIDDTSPQTTAVEQPSNGKPITYSPGREQGQAEDSGNAARLPNLGESYRYWSAELGKRENFFTWDPNVSGRFRIWLSWGAWTTHSQDARYILDQDGDLKTTNDQTEIANINQRLFADDKPAIPEQRRWSGLKSAGIHQLTEKSILILRSGDKGGPTVADVVAFEELADDSGKKTQAKKLNPNLLAPILLPKERNTVSPIVPHLRAPVSHLATEDRFDTTEAKFLRFTIISSSGSEPCLDELEIFTPTSKNIARTAKVSVSSTYADGTNANHKREHLNDGQYGNSRSWISKEKGSGWIQLEFAKPERIDRIVWSRDRSTGKGKHFEDRIALGYRVEVSSDGKSWTSVASNSDRLTDSYRKRIATIPTLSDVPADKAEEIAKLTQKFTRLAEEIQKLTRLPMAYAGNFSQPGPTNRMHRGDPTQPREVVAPGALKQIGKPLILSTDTAEQDRRLALANWIADPANPLTARVIVNRLWHYHFGTGLVDTPSDFGINGARPSHPELLDFLASELIAHKWSLKHIHKLILMSKTYRQSSRMNEVAYKADSNARLLWRFPPRRLEAEAVRDAMLVTSGQLDFKMGGPGFDLFEPNDNYVKVYQTKADYGPAEFRRMVYQSKPRTMLDDFFGAFDCPDAGQPAPKRTSSTTPLQALNLLNSHFAMQQAEAFATRAIKESGSDLAKQICRTFELIFQRPPSSEEQTDAIALAKSHGLPALCRALFNSNEFIRLN